MRKLHWGDRVHLKQEIMDFYDFAEDTRFFITDTAFSEKDFVFVTAKRNGFDWGLEIDKSYVIKKTGGKGK